jgi:hypothetical protein
MQYRIIGKFGEIRYVERGQIWHLQWGGEGLALAIVCCEPDP